MELFDVFAVILGVSLCVSGILAVWRRSTRASPEGEDMREYIGQSALTLGLLWILLGVFLLAASIGPHVGCAACSKFRGFAKMYLDG